MNTNFAWIKAALGVRKIKANDLTFIESGFVSLHSYTSAKMVGKVCGKFAVPKVNVADF